MKKTLNTAKKGFTLIELLFVMAVIAILAGMAIANLKGSTDTAIKTSLKNDIKNAIAVEETSFANTQTYVAADSAADGVVDGKITGTDFTISDNNVLTITNVCKDGTTAGFYITAENPNVTKTYEFDKCTQGKIKEI